MVLHAKTLVEEWASPDRVGGNSALPFVVKVS